MATPKILFVDIETRPIEARLWAPGKQYVSHEQMTVDWGLLSWSAKWRGEKKVFYEDARKSPLKDKPILKKLWKLLDSADIVVAQNGDRFDIPKLNARVILNGFQKPTTYKTLDTRKMASRIFGFTSNSLAYLAKALLGEKKGEHKKFPGRALWDACLDKNIQAFNEMKEYNIKDTILMERLFERLLPWDNSINFDVYSPDKPKACSCGNTSFHARGYHYTAVSRFQCYRCTKCGKQSRAAKNELSQKDQQKMGRGFR